MSSLRKYSWDYYAKLAQEKISTEPEEAIKLFKKSISLNPDSAWPFLALQHLIGNNLDELILMDKAHEIEPSNPWPLLQSIHIHHEALSKIYKSFVTHVDLHQHDTADKNLQERIEECMHFFIEYKKSKAFKKINLEDIMLDDLQKIKITQYKYKNHFDCICLLLCNKEIENNRHHKLIDRILQNTNPSQFSQNITFYICIPNNSFKDKITLDAKRLDALFKEVVIIDINMPEMYDKYTLTENDTDLSYGSFPGPNYMFFNIFDQIKHHNTALFLETDVYLSEQWIDKLHYFVEYSGGFWISGATYDGYMLNTESGDFIDQVFNNHINGGTALYACGNNDFINFVKHCQKSLHQYCVVYNGRYSTPYDYFIYIAVRSLSNTLSYCIDGTYKYIKRQYLKNNLILNFSTSSDTKKNLKDIQNKYNYAIIHKKDLQ